MGCWCGCGWGGCKLTIILPCRPCCHGLKESCLGQIFQVHGRLSKVGGPFGYPRQGIQQRPLWCCQKPRNSSQVPWSAGCSVCESTGLGEVVRQELRTYAARRGLGFCRLFRGAWACSWHLGVFGVPKTQNLHNSVAERLGRSQVSGVSSSMDSTQSPLELLHRVRRFQAMISCMESGRPKCCNHTTEVWSKGHPEFTTDQPSNHPTSSPLESQSSRRRRIQNQPAVSVRPPPPPYSDES